MKLMFISDIHGSAYYFNQISECIATENPDLICLLGDLLYHGPRNPLPKGYDPKVVLAGLNQLKTKILAIRGNCDSEVDQMVLEFPMMADYSMIFYQGRKLFLTHGHLFDQIRMPELNHGDCIISGHTHIPLAEINQGVYALNPGSISLPKEDNPPTYGIIHDAFFLVKTLDGAVFLEKSLKPGLFMRDNFVNNSG